MSLQTLWDSGRVQRYHSNPQMARHGQTNADHQWGCVALLLALHPDPGIELIQAVVQHDVDELFGGDLPFHFKIQHPDFAEDHGRLSQRMAEDAGIPPIYLVWDEDLAWLNLVDRLESFLYMRMHGQSWSDDNIGGLLQLAEKLNVKPQIKEIIHGK